MPKLFVLFVIMIAPLALFSQRHGFLKYGVGFSYDNIGHASDDPTAHFSPSHKVITEFLYDQYIGKYLSVEAGIRDKYVETRVDFYDLDTSSLRIATNFFQFPLHVKWRLPFLKNFLFTPSGGATVLISHTFNNYDARLVGPWEDVTMEKKFPKNYITLELGAGLHYLISPSWKVSVEYYYDFSSKTLAIATMHNNSNGSNSSIRAKGNFSLFTVGVGYRLSNIWIKDEAPKGKLRGKRWLQ